MKISNSQVTAIVGLLKTQKAKEYNLQFDKLQKSKIIQDQAGKYSKLLAQIPEKFRNTYVKTKSDFAKVIVKDKIGDFRFDWQHNENIVVAQSCECENLSQLYKKLKLSITV